MSGEHAPLAPSASSCWVHCALHPTMTKLYPEAQDSEPAMEGIAAHWVIEEIANEGREVKLDDLAPNGIAVSEEMLEGAEVFIERIGGLEFKGEIEDRVTMFKTIHAENWGRPDYHEYDKSKNTITVVDYKFGFGYVDAFENWQCINYVAGVLEKHNLSAVQNSKMKVRIEVVQPRCYTREGPIRVWETTVGELIPYLERLSVAAHSAMDPQPTATPGEHCEHCLGRHACEALQVEALRASDWAYEVVPLEIPINAASRELRAMSRAFKLMEARITGLQEMLLATLRKGGQVPNFQIERGEGRQRWTKPIEEIAGLGKLFNLDLTKMSVVTPKQAVKAGLPKEVVDSITELPVGEWKLVEVDLRKSRKIFGK